MGAKIFTPIYKVNDHQQLLLEKHLLEKHYAFLTVNISKGLLTCQGICQPSEHSITYKYNIKYTIGNTPKVFTVNPVIEYDDEIHMYSSDNRLCLHYPKDYSWTQKSHLFDTIVPWTHEWFVFYELYQITGKWHYPSVSHKKI